MVIEASALLEFHLLQPIFFCVCVLFCFFCCRSKKCLGRAINDTNPHKDHASPTEHNTVWDEKAVAAEFSCKVRLQALAYTSLTCPPICMYIFINSKPPPNIFNPIMASQRQRKYLLTRSSLSPEYMFFHLRPPQVERVVWRWKSSSEWNYVNHLLLISGH